MQTELDKARFARLWQRCAGGATATDAAAAAGAAVFNKLNAHYAEPHRHYHNAGHIIDCLARMDLAADAIAPLAHSDGVELAVWFHDVIYESGAPDNEQRSADWFAEVARPWFAPALVREVEGYIMSTLHREIPTDVGAQFVVDVDLSGLGMPRESFFRDGANIRKEFPHLSDADYLRGQNGFLQTLLARERIYATDFFYQLCEARARENIREVLERT